MFSILFSLFIFFVWIVMAITSVLEHKAKQYSGGVSLFPIIPLMPLVAWGLAWGLNLWREGLGFRIVGWLHILLLGVLLISGIKWLLQVRRNEQKARRGEA